MLKTPKISVLRGKMTFDFPVNPGSVESLKDAAGKLTSVYEHAIDLGAQVAMPEPHVTRVPAQHASEPVVPEAPDAEPPDDDLADMPENLRPHGSDRAGRRGVTP